MSFNGQTYSARIEELTERAKGEVPKTIDCDIGEIAYIETLHVLINFWREGKATTESLAQKQKELERKLLSYYQHQEMFDLHIKIYNRYSNVLTEAVKSGCPICKKIVKILDGRR